MTFPTQIQTQRLLLRCPQERDGAAFYTAVTHSLPRLAQWLSWADGLELTLAQAEASVRHTRQRFLAGEYAVYYIFVADGTLIGTVSLHDVDEAAAQAKVGYWLCTGYEGYGYITEALRALLDVAENKLALRRITLETNAANQRSIAVAQRCGFGEEAMQQRADGAATLLVWVKELG